jgi:acyl-coenzyme A synthetase/AMP-(fatty) acid ligase
MIFDIDKRNPQNLAAIDDSGQSITNGELCEFSKDFSKVIGKRTLIFILSENTIGSFAGYVACLSKKIVPLILSCNTDKELLQNLVDLYKPQFFWVPDRLTEELGYKKLFSSFGFTLLKTDFETYQMLPELALLLPTSGSTGSPKLVRHSYSNIINNAINVAAFFEITSNDRPIAILPMHYTMGLSVIASHLSREATILLVKKNLTDKELWEFIKFNKATSFTGVSFSFEVLYRLRVFRMDLPHLKIFTQGGGKLREELFVEFAQYAEKSGKKFIATYGQTEGTARMAYLPAELATSKTGSIGKAIPNGKLWLVDEHGNEIEQKEAEGQMVYSGPNVTLGYANSANDLAKGDENNGVLFTGDIASRDADGCYYIIGRMKRFLKIYGFRLSLDEMEQMIKSAYNIDCVCTGDDDHLRIIITNEEFKQKVLDLIVEKTGLFHMAVKVEVVDEIKKNEIGKTLYQ